ncbi:hypothetical protein SLEP1_g25935 [Rubroshorea leprosula]|uniref:Reverse transcriptase domain-containing protein n=1 Tax=Rubroshorea leprosula TaxID=152421 RepID=A0AAV5JRM9_9ROSI|nr:hypothetical protein SLEP1_g25935 [Rubroshorea leprosula]
MLAWNCRGLGEVSAISELKKLCFQHKPSIIFLSKTKRTATEMNLIRIDLGFEHCFAVDCVGRGGGLALLWTEEFTLQPSSASQSHIDVELVDPRGRPWRLTGFYGRPEVARREESWTLLKSIKAASTLPWLCLGDFNEILRQSKKEGGNPRPSRQMDAFAEAINYCAFKELGFKGPRFTFMRKIHGDLIKERLDRVLMNSEWLDMFLGAFSHHLLALRSDHAPILVMADTKIGRCRNPPAKLFRFENFWIKDPECEEKIKEGWKAGRGNMNMSQVLSKIASCGSLLTEWSQAKFGNIPERIKHLQQELLHIRNGSAQDNSLGTMEALEKELNNWQRKEEVLWKQRSRVQWLKEGDRNTAYFHNRASARRKKNHIAALMDDNGTSISDRTGIEAICIKYFKNLFTSRYSGPNRKILHALEGRISPLMATFLDRDFTREDITAAALEFLNKGSMEKDINLTHIVLIPKVKCLSSMKDLRPISLCNVLYKVISKVLTNRLKSILPQIISNNQSAFVPGRLIYNNVTVAFEAIHHLKHKRVGHRGDMAVKLDLSKAFDRVEWNFLEDIMRAMGFPDKWINHVMMCVRTVNLLFGKASEREAQKLLEILKEYEQVSGQQINLDKSSIFFSSNTPPAMQHQVMQTLNISQVITDDKYLGLPLIIGRKKSICFDSIRERVWSKIKGWETKLLSRAGREILIKAVRLGGLGFRDLGAFNLATLARQSWRMMHDKTTLCYQVLKAKYFPDGDLMGATMKTNASMVWRGVIAGLGILKMGSTWRIGSGRDVRIWRDNWLPSGAIPQPQIALVHHNLDDRVSDLIDEDRGCWKEAAVRHSFRAEDAEAILHIPISRRCSIDRLIWLGTNNGKFTVKSAYKYAWQLVFGSEHHDHDQVLLPIWKAVWFLNVPPKIKHVLWRIIWENLPYRDILLSRGIDVEPGCGICNTTEESYFHLFFDCEWSKKVWNGVLPTTSWHSIQHNSFLDDFLASFLATSAANHEIVAVTL